MSKKRLSKDLAEEVYIRLHVEIDSIISSLTHSYLEWKYGHQGIIDPIFYSLTVYEDLKKKGKLIFLTSDLREKIESFYRKREKYNELNTKAFDAMCSIVRGNVQPNVARERLNKDRVLLFSGDFRQLKKEIGNRFSELGDLLDKKIVDIKKDKSISKFIKLRKSVIKEGIELKSKLIELYKKENEEREEQESKLKSSTIVANWVSITLMFCLLIANLYMVIIANNSSERQAEIAEMQVNISEDLKNLFETSLIPNKMEIVCQSNGDVRILPTDENGT